MSKEAEKQEAGSRQGVSKVKLAVGAAGLLLFIVGVKRSFRLGEVAVEDGSAEEEPEEVEEPVHDSLLGRRRRGR